MYTSHLPSLSAVAAYLVYQMSTAVVSYRFQSSSSNSPLEVRLHSIVCCQFPSNKIRQLNFATQPSPLAECRKSTECLFIYDGRSVTFEEMASPGPSPCWLLRSKGIQGCACVTRLSLAKCPVKVADPLQDSMAAHDDVMRTETRHLGYKPFPVMIGQVGCLLQSSFDASW